MGVSTIESVASFSIVMAEAFAAVGLSTLMPAGFIAATRAAQAALEAAGKELEKAGENTQEAEDARKKEAEAKARLLSLIPHQEIASGLVAVANSSPSLDILLPKTAKIHAEFEFQGSDKITESLEVGGMIEVVTVKAGFSMLYETKTRNKIELDIDFVSVNVPIRSAT